MAMNPLRGWVAPRLESPKAAAPDRGFPVTCWRCSSIGGEPSWSGLTALQVDAPSRNLPTDGADLRWADPWAEMDPEIDLHEIAVEPRIVQSRSTTTSSGGVTRSP